MMEERRRLIENAIWGTVLPMLAFGIYEEIRMYIHLQIKPSAELLLEMYIVSYSLLTTVLIFFLMILIRLVITRRRQ